jgi:alpha-beta hydrolase superfamily lysophospholipase
MTFSIFLIAPLLVGDVPPMADIESRAAAFVEALNKGDFDAAEKDFDEAMKKALPKDKLESLAKTLEKQVGKLKTRGKLRREKQAPYEIVFVPCEFEKTTLEVRLVFNRTGQISGLNFLPPESSDPPPYARKDSFTESDVSFGSEEWRLPATLTMPKGDGPFPAAVLVHGSGPQDRDETVGSTKIFRDLAWGLASRGIAVLRYVKRTKQYPLKVVALDQFSVKDETIDDAVAAAETLRKTPKVDPKRVFVIGHSLGAMMAPRIALDDQHLAGIVMLAAPTRTLVTLILEQTEREMKKTVSDDEKSLLTKLRTIAQKLKDKQVTTSTPRSELMGMPAGYWLEFADYTTPPDAAKLKIPMLILQGEADEQVTMDDFVGWQKVAASWKNAILKSYPNLGHEFIVRSKSKFMSEPVVVDIANWISTH